MKYASLAVAALASISTVTAWNLNPNVGTPECEFLNGYGEYDFTSIDCTTDAKIQACNNMCTLQDAHGCDWADCFDNDDLYVASCQNAANSNYNDPINDLKCATESKQRKGSCYNCDQSILTPSKRALVERAAETGAPEM